MLAVPTVREALAWARFPVVELRGQQVRVADLRYHLRGQPTLTFVIDLEPAVGGFSVRSARLERGGSARELLERWRGQQSRP